MIYVDDRVGSKELFHLFPHGKAELAHLEYADFAFDGHGDEGTVMIGVERKRIGDFVNCMCSGRLSGHQLIGLLNSYHVVYLVIEGLFRANPQTGILETWKRGQWSEYTAGKRRFMARDIWVFMNTLQTICGIHCYHCPRETDTVQYILALHHWWNKEYADHKGHLQPHTGKVVDISKQSVLRRCLLQLTGPGWEMSKALDMRFKSVFDLMTAPVDEIAKVSYGREGKKHKRIGKQTASAIVEQLMGVRE